MNEVVLDAFVKALVTTPGLRGCAAVEPDSGLVVARQGDSDESLWEAAVEYWRMQSRLHRHFASLGELRAAVMHHQRGALAVFPCKAASPLLIVCLGALRGTDWASVQQQVLDLSHAIRPPARAC
jgi:hypothetical protein